MSEKEPGKHFSTYYIGEWKKGAWHCPHGKAAELVAETSWNSDYVGNKYWRCASKTCRFWVWEDHIQEAMDYHKVPGDEAEKMKVSLKRKRDGNITEYFPITPKTPRTRDAEAEAEAEGGSEEDLYELSDRESPSPDNRRDDSPSPLSRRSNAPSRSFGPPSPDRDEEVRRPAVPPPAAPQPQRAPERPAIPRPYEALGALLDGPAMAAPYVAPQFVPPPVVVPDWPRPRTPPSEPRQAAGAGAALAPPPAVQPRTPQSNNRRGRRAMREMPPPNPPTPGSRGLSAQELDSYNIALKALSGADVKLTVKAQSALREIIKSGDLWIGG